jgi:tetratricopeptide (TPR) repeat protein
MAIQLDSDTSLNQEEDLFQHSLPNYYRSFLKNFRKASISTLKIHLLFFSLFSVQLICFFALLPLKSSSLFFAVFISTFFLSFFTYIVLLFYFQAKKPEVLFSLQEEFIVSCRRMLSSPVGNAGHHLTIAEALIRLSTYLQDFEWGFYKLPFKSLFVTRISAYFHFHDVFEMKEWLLESAIHEHLKQIRLTPTDLELHASLASTYVAMSKLYKDPLSMGSHPRSGHFRKKEGEFEERAQQYSRLAIEEFTILSHYAMDDPWVHEQMAMGYRDLKIPEKEIEEMETLLNLKPRDKEILYRLGKLYFSQKYNAKGLQVYEELKKTNFKKAEDLIATYGKTPDSIT